MRVPALGLLCVAFVGCSGTNSVTAAFSPTQDGAVNDGKTPTTLTVTVQLNSQQASDGTSVAFSIGPVSGTSAQQVFASFAPIVNGTSPTQTTNVSTAGGSASVQIYDVVPEAIQINITAKGTAGSSSSVMLSTTGLGTMRFGGTYADGGICPSSFISTKPASFQTGIATTISFSCFSLYMGGYFTGDINKGNVGNTQVCTAIVQDAQADSIQGAPVALLTEAGQFQGGAAASGQAEISLTDMTGAAKATYEVTEKTPQDVEPTCQDGTIAIQFGAACPAPPRTPCPVMPQTQPGCTPRNWVDAQGNIHNPRDGWVTMVAATPGYVPSGVAISEPYVDENDNGQYDPGEPYIDANCNGQFDAVQQPDANGLVRIWATTTIVWVDTEWIGCGTTQGCIESGFMFDSPGGCSTGNLGAMASCSETFRFVDQNLNMLSVYGSGNSIQFTTTGPTTPTPQGMGGIDVSGLTLPSLVLDPDFTGTATDTCSTTCPNSMPWSLSAAGTFNYGPMSTQHYGFTVQGGGAVE